MIGDGRLDEDLIGHECGFGSAMVGVDRVGSVVGVEQCVLAQRGVETDNRLTRFVVDEHELGRVGGRFVTLGHDGHDRLADKANPVGG